MPTAAKPSFTNPWAFASGTSLQPEPRWWKKRQALQPLFLNLLERDGWPMATESELWSHGVSSRHIAEFFCLVARYGKEQVISHYFDPHFDPF